MPLMTFGRCWRGRKDCYSFDVIEGTAEEISQENFEDLNFTPDTFVCCGATSCKTRNQDCFRLCFKSKGTDSMTDNDFQDLAHLQKVISTAIALYSTYKVNSGKVDIFTLDDGGAPCGLKAVKTQQGMR